MSYDFGLKSKEVSFQVLTSFCIQLAPWNIGRHRNHSRREFSRLFIRRPILSASRHVKAEHRHQKKHDYEWFHLALFLLLLFLFLLLLVLHLLAQSKWVSETCEKIDLGMLFTR